MKAVGIDLGGTKIEAQLFDEHWQVVEKRRVATPKDYPALVTALSDLIGWADDAADRHDLPVGIGAAGLLNPATGNVLTANICADGKPLPSAINKVVGRPITYINDCRALALSEAVFGVGQGHATVMTVILGTGVGGGIAAHGNLVPGPTFTGGEFGHCSASAALVLEHKLPLVRCGCGRMGCIETYLAGPGLERIALSVTGVPATSREVAAQRTGAMQDTWAIWLDLAADMLRNQILTIDPDVIVLGGGLSNIEGITDELTTATRAAQIGDFNVPPIVLAQGGEASGARGAAYAAWQAIHD